MEDTWKLLRISGDVRKMMEVYLGKGHTLFTDNWYSCPLLSDFLHVSMTDLYGIRAWSMKMCLSSAQALMVVKY